jgi:hypothetical protein
MGRGGGARDEFLSGVLCSVGLLPWPFRRTQRDKSVALCLHASTVLRRSVADARTQDTTFWLGHVVRCCRLPPLCRSHPPLRRAPPIVISPPWSTRRLFPRKKTMLDKEADERQCAKEVVRQELTAGMKSSCWGDRWSLPGVSHQPEANFS